MPFITFNKFSEVYSRLILRSHFYFWHMRKVDDELAFQKFFQQWHPPLYAYLLRLTKLKEIAEELAMDIFLKIWEERENLPDIQNINAYLYKMAHHKAIDFFRLAARNARLQKVIAQEIQVLQSQEADRALLDAECEAIFHEAVEHLTPQRRDIFLLSRVNGLTHNEIAHKLNVSRHTVRNTIAKSLQSVREFVKQYGLLLLFLWRS